MPTDPRSSSPTTSTPSSTPSAPRTPRSCLPCTARPGSPATLRATSSPSGSRRWSMSTPRPGSRPSTPPSTMSRSPSTGMLSPRRRTSTGSARSRSRRSATGLCRSRARSCAKATNSPATPDGYPEHDHRSGLYIRGLPVVRERAPGMGIPGRHPGAARHHLGRPADEPLADVVAPPGARRHHRRHREGSRPGA